MQRSLGRWFLPAGLLVTAAYLFLPETGPARAIAFAGLNLATVVAIVVGVRSHRPRRRLPWLLLGAGYLSYVCADVIWYTDPAPSSAADVFFLVAYSLLVVGLATAARARNSGRDRGGFLDALIVTTGIGVLSWIFLMSPNVNDTSLPLPAQIVSLAYPLMDMLLLAVLVRGAFLATLEDRAFRLLGLGIVAQMSADTLYAVSLSNGTFDHGHPLMLGYLTSFVLVGSAALHPSMRELTEVLDADHTPARGWRLGLLGASALVLPVVLVSESLRGAIQNIPVLAAIAGLLFLLVLARVGQLMSDLTERKAMETRLREAETKYRHLVERLPGVVYTAAPGPQGRWTYVSPQIEPLLGFTPEEWSSDPKLWLDRLHPDDRERVITAEAENVADATDADRVNDEYRLVARTGRSVWVRDEATLVLDERGEPAFFRGVLFDITERKELEDQLRQSQKMEAIGRLAGGVAHDFNNLLAVVQNYARFVAEDLPPGDPRYDDLQEVIKAGERGAQLTRQLLTFSRREVVQPCALDLNELVSDLYKMLSRMIPVSVQLTTTLAPRLWRTWIDPGQVEQILMNLAVNAKDAMPGGGRMTIATSNVAIGPDAAVGARLHPGEYVRVSVSDTGCGMTKEVHSRIFEPFFTTKPKGQGTGLGLATVYGIVEQARGHIVATSEVGHGTTFEVYLPRAAKGAPQTPVDSLEQPVRHGEGKVILVVEDEDPVRDLVVRILRRHAYTVLSAANGMDAIKLVESYAGAIDLLLADVVMPDVSGKAVSERTGLVTLYMSGYTDEVVAEQGVLAEDENLIQKPFAAEQLLRSVRAVLARAAPGAPAPREPATGGV